MAIGKMIKEKDKGKWLTLMVTFMKDNGKMTKKVN